MDRVLAKSVDSAIAAGQIDYRFVPNTEISQDLTTLQSLQPADAVQYFQLHPSLWPIWCSCTTSKLGETTLNPDGSFSYCYTKFLLPILTCFKSYFYKVKQFQNGAWVYIYDGSAAHQYFNADQVANLSTFLGAACGTTTPPPPGTDFVTLQQIGGTQSGNLHSNYLGASAANIDLTQTGPYSVATPPADGGLVNANDAPWCNTLSFMLAFDPGMEALGAYYYRFSYAPADLNGNPIGAMRVVPPGATVPPAIGWSKFVSAVVGGNSVMKSKARRLARTLSAESADCTRSLTTAMFNRAEGRVPTRIGWAGSSIIPSTRRSWTWCRRAEELLLRAADGSCWLSRSSTRPATG